MMEVLMTLDQANASIRCNLIKQEPILHAVFNNLILL